MSKLNRNKKKKEGERLRTKKSRGREMISPAENATIRGKGRNGIRRACSRRRK